jgi:hypothetical protein
MKSWYCWAAGASGGVGTAKFVPWGVSATACMSGSCWLLV